MNIALFTTVYPEGKKYLRDWHSSLVHQCTDDFDIWIGCDRLPIEETKDAMNGPIEAEWVIRTAGESPIQFRERAIRQMMRHYSGIIFVDSDDILEPSRVSSARDALYNYDVYGCAMRIIDEQGSDLNLSFKQPSGSKIEDLLIRNNIFGLSNTAYRSKLIEMCLPFPPDSVLLDWFLATRALNSNATFFFDDTVRMRYRQHSSNTARVLPPFSRNQIIDATNLVLMHYSSVLKDIPDLKPEIKNKIIISLEEINQFYKSITKSPDIMERYLEELNKLHASHIWWSCVAHPMLEEIWKR